MRTILPKIVFLFLTTLVVNAQVGINTTNPETMLHIEGTTRLEHSSARNGKLLQMAPDGSIIWSSPYNLQLISGSLKANGVTMSIDDHKYFTGASITLPKGKFLVKGCFLIRTINTLALNQSSWVTIYLSDSATSSTVTTDVIENSAQQMSGGISGSLYAILDGSLAIENTSNIPKTYYLWGYKQNFGAANTTNHIYDFAGSNWGENIIYALAFD